MTTISSEFPRRLDEAVVAANRALGVTPGHVSGGGVVDDLDERTMDLHEAGIQLLLAVESLQNWSVEVTRALASLGVDVQ